MAIGFGVAAPKGEPRKRARNRVKRKARSVVKSVRALVGERDGDCRIGSTTTLFGPCEGVSELMHLGESRRYKTRGQPAEARHTTSGTARGCSRHHALYDRHELTIEPLTEQGADSTLRVTCQGVSVLSVPGGERQVR